MEVGADIIVKGVVQGVGFRFFVSRYASSLQLAGETENLLNGDVRIEVEGERSAVEELIRYVKIGPKSARVSAVDIRWKAPMRKFRDFIIL